jgi:hypothetical protein
MPRLYNPFAIDSFAGVLKQLVVLGFAASSFIYLPPTNPSISMATSVLLLFHLVLLLVVFLFLSRAFFFQLACLVAYKLRVLDINSIY